jgi:hypothetical protein
MALRCIALCCVALHWTALHWTALDCIGKYLTQHVQLMKTNKAGDFVHDCTSRAVTITGALVRALFRGVEMSAKYKPAEAVVIAAPVACTTKRPNKKERM